jgi:hypothetical protein
MREELCGLVVPSKVSGVLAAGRPCVFLGPRQSEAARLILDCACGSVLENADGAALAECLTEWARSPKRPLMIGTQSRLAAQHVSLERALNAFRRLFRQLTGNGPQLELENSAHKLAMPRRPAPAAARSGQAT